MNINFKDWNEYDDDNIKYIWYFNYNVYSDHYIYIAKYDIKEKLISFYTNITNVKKNNYIEQMNIPLRIILYDKYDNINNSNIINHFQYGNNDEFIYLSHNKTINKIDILSKIDDIKSIYNENIDYLFY